MASTAEKWAALVAANAAVAAYYAAPSPATNAARLSAANAYRFLLNA